MVYKLSSARLTELQQRESTPVFQQMMQHGGRKLIFEAFELGLKWIPGYRAIRYTRIKCDSVEVERPVMAASSLISEKLAPIMASLTARRSNVERYDTARMGSCCQFLERSIVDVVKEGPGC